MAIGNDYLLSVTTPSSYSGTVYWVKTNGTSGTTLINAGSTASISCNSATITISGGYAIVSYLSITNASISRTSMSDIEIGPLTAATAVTFANASSQSCTFSVPKTYISSWSQNATYATNPTYTTITSGTGNQSVTTYLYRDNFGTSSSTKYRYFGYLYFKLRSPYSTNYLFNYTSSTGTLTRFGQSDGGGSNEGLRNFFFTLATTSSITMTLSPISAVNRLYSATGTDKTLFMPVLLGYTSLYSAPVYNIYAGTTQIVYNYTDTYASIGSMMVRVSSTTGTIKDTNNYYYASSTYTFTSAIIWDSSHPFSVASPNYIQSYSLTAPNPWVRVAIRSTASNTKVIVPLYYYVKK